jgi:hypothetical protein
MQESDQAADNPYGLTRGCDCPLLSAAGKKLYIERASPDPGLLNRREGV